MKNNFMISFKYLKCFTLVGASVAVASVVGVSTYAISSSRKSFDYSSINNQSHLVTHSTGAANQKLGTIRQFKNNSFTGIPIKNSIDGSLVLTGKSSITRTDFFGNVLWTFDPNIPSDIVAAKSDNHGNLISNGDGTPVLSGKNYSADLAGKMVIEATQDKVNPNLFYLLLIPQDYLTNTSTYAQINSDVKNQGTIVAISENFDLNNQPYGIVGIQNIKASDMVKNYPTSWNSSAATGPTFFTKTNHPNYFDGSGTYISMPWKIYITNLSNIYGSEGIVYIAGGNGTIFSDEDILSIGMFRVKFDFSAQTSVSSGWPYALILSNIGVTFDITSTNPALITNLTNLPMGQDANYQYIPRMAVAGLVATNAYNNDNRLSLIGTISIGVKTDEGAPSSGTLAAVTPSNIGANIVSTSNVTAAAGNSYTVQTLFEAYLNLQSLNSLSNQIIFSSSASGAPTPNDIQFSTVLSSPSSISVGVPFEAWNNSTTTGKNYFESYLYTLVGVGNFSPRDIGNVVSFENSDDNNYRSYYFQLGGYLLKMYLPALDQFKFTSSRLSIYQDSATSNKTFATLTSDTGAKNTWADFLGTFMIGGDNNLQSTETIIGSVWKTGIYYNKYEGAGSNPQVSFVSSTYVKNSLTAPTSITATAYTNPSTAVTTNGILGYKIDNLLSVPVALNVNFNGVVSSTGMDQAYVQIAGGTDYSPLVYKQNAASLTIDPAYNQDSKVANLGSGKFKSPDKIDQSFFTNSITSILTTSGNTTILDPRYRSVIFDYSPGANISSTDWRLVVLNSNVNENTLTLTAEVKNPSTGQYVPIPNLSNQSTLLNSATFTGFNALPAYVIPVAVALPIVIIALIVGLSLGIGIPMSKNKKALKQGFDISNKKVDTLTTAVGSVFKQIINRTQIGNIKKSPQMLKSASKAKTPPKPPIAAKPAAPAPAGNSKPPVKPPAPAPKKNEDAKK